MTGKQTLWLSEYFKTWNATDAARKAGYRWPDKVGSQLKERMADVIRQELEARVMSADEVLTRTAEIARGDLTKFITADGDIDIEAMKAAGEGVLLKKYQRTRKTRTLKDDSILETETLVVELYAADAAHDRIMRHLGLYRDRIDVTSNGQDIVTRIEVAGTGEPEHTPADS